VNCFSMEASIAIGHGVERGLIERSIAT